MIPVVWDWSIHSSIFWLIGSMAITAVIVAAGIEITELHDRRVRRRKDKRKP